MAPPDRPESVIRDTLQTAALAIVGSVLFALLLFAGSRALGVQWIIGA